MNQFTINTTYKKILADTTTPVSIYLRLRDVFPNSLLLESSDYHSRENSASYICCEPFGGLVLNNGTLKMQYPDGTEAYLQPGTYSLPEEVDTFLKGFHTVPAPVKLTSNGLFGYFTHEAVEHFETIKLKTDAEDMRKIPEMQYHFYRYIIGIDHFKNELYIFHNQLKGESSTDGLEKIEYLIKNKNFPEYHFQAKDEAARVSR